MRPLDSLAARSRAAHPQLSEFAALLPFELDDFTRWRLMEGLDDIGLTLRHLDAVEQYESARKPWLPAVAG